jgi:hypothetical protein
MALGVFGSTASGPKSNVGLSVLVAVVLAAGVTLEVDVGMLGSDAVSVTVWVKVGDGLGFVSVPVGNGVSVRVDVPVAVGINGVPDVVEVGETSV